MATNPPWSEQKFFNILQIVWSSWRESERRWLKSQRVCSSKS